MRGGGESAARLGLSSGEEVALGEPRLLTRGFQTVLRLLYPPRCLRCDAQVESEHSLCGTCWRDTPLIAGLVCDACGTPLPGDTESGPVYCDDCLTIARPWRAGRAALLYKEVGRDLVLALKHADRLDVAQSAGNWLLQAAQPLLAPDSLIVPVPLHWKRLAARRYNQSALLAHALADKARCACLPDALVRHRPTQSLDGLSRDARFATLQDAIIANPRHTNALEGRRILLVDDVMTSGATLAACCEALVQSRASDVCVVTLARVAKDA